MDVVVARDTPGHIGKFSRTLVRERTPRVHNALPLAKGAGAKVIETGIVQRQVGELTKLTARAAGHVFCSV